MTLHRELTEAEWEDFIKSNRHGILAFGGDQPYAIPMGYQYRNRCLLLGFVTADSRKKMECLQRSPNICFTICRPRWATEGLKNPCTTIIVEGELVPVTDRSAYGFPARLPEAMTKLGIELMRIQSKSISGRQCTRKPCELFEMKRETSAGAYGKP